MQYTLQTPLKKSDLAPLRAGDTVLLSGVVYTARDAAHARMMKLLDAGKELPFPMEGAAVYYVGPHRNVRAVPSVLQVPQLLAVWMLIHRGFWIWGLPV